MTKQKRSKKEEEKSVEEKTTLHGKNDSIRYLTGNTCLKDNIILIYRLHRFVVLLSFVLFCSIHQYCFKTAGHILACVTPPLPLKEVIKKWTHTNCPVTISSCVVKPK